MPTRSPATRLRAEDVPAIVGEVTFPDREEGRPDGIGLEAEVFPIRVGDDGATTRLGLDEAAAIARAWATEERGVLPTDDHPALLGFALSDGTRVTFEPGGQLELSGPVQRSASHATAALQSTLASLAVPFAAHGVVLASAGIDLWHDVAAVPQQLRSPRYPAMAASLAQRSSAGAVMMRHTCSLQVNLDPGAGVVRDERWLVANLVAPLAVASFATSPGILDGVASARAQTWRALDPTRTGIPSGLVAGVADPAAQMTIAALDADVLLLRDGDAALPGTPGFTFQRWLEEGHPDLGWPTDDDLAYHLTTLFHEVRPRGALEIRSVDALPARWRVVPVVLYAGLLYDDRARHRVLSALGPWQSRLPEALVRAGRAGVADAALCAAAVEAWSYAIEGAGRLGDDVVGGADIARAEAFVDRFTMRGRCPGDELRERYLDDPSAALSWATEPVPTVALC